jgi:hypothetical protein
MDATLKEVKTIFGTDVKAERMHELLVELHKVSNSSVDEKTKILNQQIEGLTKSVSEYEQKYKQINTEYEQTKQDSKLIMKLPKTLPQGISSEDALILLKKDVSFEDVDGLTVTKISGQVVTDPKTFKPLSQDDALSGYFKQRGWTEQAPPSGRGGSNSKPSTATGSYKNAEDVRDAFISQGKNPNSPEFVATLQEAAKSNPNFVW